MWNRVGEKIEHVFGRQALPLVWDFAEVAIFSDATGNYRSAIELIAEVVGSSASAITGQTQLADATRLPLPNEVASIWFTDPPYYDAVPYADLSDFFFVWLKRALPGHALLRDPYDPNNTLTPKTDEAVQDETKFVDGRPKDRVFFENKMALAFEEGRRTVRDDGIGSVVFAHKTTEGWEALLSGMTRGGWVITGSWPIATERPGRLRAQESAALSTSVHLICRPRTEDRIGDWADVLRELPGRVADWMARLEREGVRGADLVFACIGPALEIFSRYSRVETPDGREVPLAEYLEKVWEVVGRAALEQVLGTTEARARNGGAGALEEDARLTALFLWTLKSTAGEDATSEDDADSDDEGEEEEEETAGGKKSKKGFSLAFDIVRRFAQPLGIHLENWAGRIIETDKGIVRLLPVAERAKQLFGDEEMTDWDAQWQARLEKIVRRVAKDLIVNDESEVSEVVRRRLFESLGDEKVRRKVAKEYADWCFERRAQLPAQWTAADVAVTEGKARDALLRRFEACYPFHPATLSVFQRKWQTLPLFQQTRGTLAMFAQWLSKAYVTQHRRAWPEPLITLGSAPLDARDFRASILGVLGEPKLNAAIEADIAGGTAHAAALDLDLKGSFRSLHTRVATAILFESSGGQTDKAAHLPELRFALGGPPDIETTTIDNAADALERHAYFFRKVGTDGFRIGPRAKLIKVMADRRASLDDETEVKPTIRALVKELFEKGAVLPSIPFPEDGAAVQDTPRLAIVVMDPALEWDASGALAKRIEEWTLRRGASDRLYPASLIWCVRKPGRELMDKTEIWLAWKRVAEDLRQGLLGEEGDPEERREVQVRVKDALEVCTDEIWGSYRFVILLDRATGRQAALKVIDLGAGHASSGETLTGRIVAALRSQGLLDNSVGAGYIDRHWPQALLVSGAWPLSGLRQSFLDGSFTRLLDPDKVLRSKIVEFVEKGEFGLASGARSDNSYERAWFGVPVDAEEVTFDSDIYLLKKLSAERLKRPQPESPEAIHPPQLETAPSHSPGATDGVMLPSSDARTIVLRVVGKVMPEHWNRLGTRLVPKLRTNSADGSPVLQIDFSVNVSRQLGLTAKSEVTQILADLGLDKELNVEIEEDR
jgi:hypothetical protein